MNQTTRASFYLPSHDELLTWRPLRHLNYYRLVLSMAFLVIFYKSSWMSFLGSEAPQAFLLTALIMLLSSLVFIGLSLQQKPSFESQVIISNTSDILLITLLAHFSGGLSSSLSILLIINVAATGSFLKDRYSFLFAALASIAIISEQTYSLMQGTSQQTEYTRAGLLGLVFFVSSFLASVLSRRVRLSEQLAIEREEDIINLEILNEDIIQNMRTGIIVVDHDAHIRLANSSAESLLGHIPLSNQPQLKQILPSLDERYHEWLEQPQMHQNPIRQAHGLPDIQPGFRKLNSTNNRSGDTLIFLEDATQLNQRFQQIKLASLGRLTASIAHEIRNPLSAINHAAQLLNESELDEADNKLTKIINTQVQRLDTIIDNVLQLSRQKEKTPEVINIVTWLSSFKEEFCNRHEITAEQLEIKINTDKTSILFDSSHLYQVIDNLCSNSINHNDKEKKLIEIQIIYDFDDELKQPYLDIVDNGPGIDAEFIQQIFDPFFTRSSKGTGLGLYISKEIIEINRAKIRYIEENKVGSCFRIYFLLASIN